MALPETPSPDDHHRRQTHRDCAPVGGGGRFVPVSVLPRPAPEQAPRRQRDGRRWLQGHSADPAAPRHLALEVEHGLDERIDVGGTTAGGETQRGAPIRRTVLHADRNIHRARHADQTTAKGLTLTTYGAEDSAALVETIRVNHAGQTVLVVAHANTVDDIAGALGMPGVGELADSQFDRMYVIVRNWCGTRLTRLRYGAATP